MSLPSRYFRRSEFACRCGCGADTVDAELVALLNRIREHFDAPVIVNSGMRCPIYNAIVGGSENSFHLRGKAADIVIRGESPKEIRDFVDSIDRSRYGVGIYPRFTHVDVREHAARWAE